MNTLAYIGEESERLLGSGSLERRETAVIAGMEVTRTITETWPVESYMEDVTKLRARLATKDIKPLAVLPLTWWDKICKESGLIRVSGGSNTLKVGLTPIQADVFGAYFLGIPTAAVATFLGSWLLGAFYGNAAALAGTVFVVLVALAGFSTTADRVVAWLCTPTAKSRARALLQAVQAVKTEERDSQVRDVPFRLPPPPPEVVSILTRLTGLYEVSVAAEPSAFRLGISLPQLVGMAKRDRRTALFTEFNDAMNDPIIYVRHGAAVAILAQYGGELKIERAVIDRVLGTSINA